MYGPKMAALSAAMESKLGPTTLCCPRSMCGAAPAIAAPCLVDPRAVSSCSWSLPSYG